MTAERVRLLAQFVVGEGMLQWGRGWLTAESMILLRAQATRDRASMGPRLVDRGEEANKVAYYGVGMASMGPRLVDRGEWGEECCFVRSKICFNGAAVG